MKVKKLKNYDDWGMPSRTGIGVTVSVIYAGLLISLATWRWSDIATLKLNELGDFAAGAFGPMAILWLVLGYFQQGDELKQNTDALKLQAEELANSASQQAALVALTREQLDAERQRLAEEKRELHRLNQPRFHFDSQLTGAVSGTSFFLIKATNVGANCSHVRFHGRAGDRVDLKGQSLARLDSGGEINIELQISNTQLLGDTELRISYFDALGKSGEQKATVFTVPDGKNGWSLKVRGPQDMTMAAIHGHWD
jgi:hypothetical protein